MTSASPVSPVPSRRPPATHRHPGRRRRWAVLWVTAALALAACGGGDDTAATPDGTGPGGNGETGTATELVVIARDIAFDRDSYRVPAGRVRIRYVDEGSITHTLRIEELPEVFLEVGGNGDEDSTTVELDPGTYTLYCDVPGHRAAGMEATLTVG